MIILSYHTFTDKPDDYPFSRTYEQFDHDLRKKIYDMITIDDARKCTIRACDMMKSYNRRAKIFVCTSLVGQRNYCSWDDLRKLSEFHDIENHSREHLIHPAYNYEWQFDSIYEGKREIIDQIQRMPRYFVPPYNQFDENTEKICEELGLILLKDRITIKNTSK